LVPKFLQLGLAGKMPALQNWSSIIGSGLPHPGCARRMHLKEAYIYFTASVNASEDGLPQGQLFSTGGSIDYATRERY
jgi:hypothetical protein